MTRIATYAAEVVWDAVSFGGKAVGAALGLILLLGAAVAVGFVLVSELAAFFR